MCFSFVEKLNWTWKHVSIFLFLNCFKLRGLQSTGIVSDAKIFQNSSLIAQILHPPTFHSLIVIKWYVNSTVILRNLILSALRVTGFSVSGNHEKCLLSYSTKMSEESPWILEEGKKNGNMSGHGLKHLRNFCLVLPMHIVFQKFLKANAYSVGGRIAESSS